MKWDNMALNTANIISKDKPQCKTLIWRQPKQLRRLLCKQPFPTHVTSGWGPGSESAKHKGSTFAVSFRGVPKPCSAQRFLVKTLQHCFQIISVRILMSSNPTHGITTWLQNRWKKSPLKAGEWERGKMPERIRRLGPRRHPTGWAKNESKTLSIYSKLISCEPKNYVWRETKTGPAAIFLWSWGMPIFLSTFH